MPAQFGEDVIVAEQFPEDFQGVAVDVGAADGVNINNTDLFERRGWRVLCIEANPLYEDKLRASRKEVVIAACADYEADDVQFTYFPLNWEAGSALKPAFGKLAKWGVREEVFRHVTTKVRKLDTLLAEANIDHVDYLSVDVEGGEMEVMRGFDLARYAPKVVVIEMWEDDGESSRYMEPFGYTRINRTYVNDIFLRNE